MQRSRQNNPWVGNAKKRKRPYIEEKNQPDKVVLTMSMESLLNENYDVPHHPKQKYRLRGDPESNKNILTSR